MRFKVLICLLCSSLSLPATSVWGQILSNTEQNSADDEKAVVEVVDQLMSPDFSVRQKATTELLKLSADALPVLKTRLKTASGEMADRLRMLIPVLQTRLFDGHIAEFQRAPSAESAKGLPEWERFCEIVGDQKDALLVYSEILRAEKELFAIRLFSPEDLPTALEVRSLSFAETCDGRRDEEFAIASCMALMLLGSNPDVRLLRTTSTCISESFDDPRFGNLIREGVHSEILKAIAGSWILRPGIAAERPLLFSMKHRISSGRTLALRIVKSGVRNQNMYYALLCLAMQGTAEDLAPVESLLKTPAVLWPPRGQPVNRLLPDADSAYSVQTRDVALAVAIHLRGRKPEDFGIPVVRSDDMLFAVHSLGFESDKARDEAFATYLAAFPGAASPAEKK